MNIKCPACKTEFSTQINNCNKCKFPFNGTEQEKSVHIGQFIMKKGILFDATNSIDKVQYILYFIAFLFALPLLMLVFVKTNVNFIDIFITIVIIFVFLFFGYFIKKHPFWFVMIPLLMLLGIYLINYIIDPSSLMRGIYFKLFVIGSLVYSLFLQKGSESFKKKFDNL